MNLAGEGCSSCRQNVGVHETTISGDMLQDQCQYIHLTGLFHLVVSKLVATLLVAGEDLCLMFELKMLARQCQESVVAHAELEEGVVHSVVSCKSDVCLVPVYTPCRIPDTDGTPARSVAHTVAVELLHKGFTCLIFVAGKPEVDELSQRHVLGV